MAEKKKKDMENKDLAKVLKEVEELKEQVEAAEKKAAEAEAKAAETEAKMAEADAKDTERKNEYLRLMAEFDTFRRRTAEEKLELVKSASADTIKGLLPVLDSWTTVRSRFPRWRRPKETRRPSKACSSFSTSSWAT